MISVFVLCRVIYVGPGYPSSSSSSFSAVSLSIMLVCVVSSQAASIVCLPLQLLFLPLFLTFSYMHVDFQSGFSESVHGAWPFLSSHVAQICIATRAASVSKIILAVSGQRSSYPFTLSLSFIHELYFFSLFLFVCHFFKFFFLYLWKQFLSYLFPPFYFLPKFLPNTNFLHVLLFPCGRVHSKMNGIIRITHY